MLDEDRIIIEDLKLLLSTEYGINELETRLYLLHNNSP